MSRKPRTQSAPSSTTVAKPKRPAKSDKAKLIASINAAIASTDIWTSQLPDTGGASVRTDLLDASAALHHAAAEAHGLPDDFRFQSTAPSKQPLAVGDVVDLKQSAWAIHGAMLPTRLGLTVVDVVEGGVIVRCGDVDDGPRYALPRKAVVRQAVAS